MRRSERLKMPPEHWWNVEVGAVLLKPHERLLMKKMPLGPQFAQGLNRGIKAVPDRGPVYSPAECVLSISKKLSEKLNCQG
jgi:hypothetical protein